MKLSLKFLSSLLCVMLLASEISSFAQVLENSTSDQKLVVDKADVFKKGNLLSYEEVEAALKSQPQALALFQKGSDQRSTGTMLLVGGIVGSVAGFGLMVSGVETKTDRYGNVTTDINGNYMLGLLLSAAGEGMIVGGIVCRIMGRSKIRRAINDFNSSSAYNNTPDKYNMSLSFQPTSIGLKLTF